MTTNKKQYFSEQCIAEASLSKATKRKVGALVVLDEQIIGRGHNYALDGGECEDEFGNTRDEVVHAEVDAIQKAKTVNQSLAGASLYSTHVLCAGCTASAKAEGIENIYVINDFLKFDVDKLRYDLIPTEATKALASVITYGAKKYKPDNWKCCSDITRYVSALMRHLEAHRSGELVDDESGLWHMSHVLTNASFIIYFLEKEKKNGKDYNKT